MVMESMEDALSISMMKAKAGDDDYYYLDAYVSLLSDCCSAPPLPQMSFAGSCDHDFFHPNHWIHNHSSISTGPTLAPPPDHDEILLLHSAGPAAKNNSIADANANTAAAAAAAAAANTERAGAAAAAAGGRAKVAFKTKSQIDVLDDGFKWRKYGKKMVKNSPNPRNYYRCSIEGCAVKKRVERDNEDSRYVLTTYEGIHNHRPPP